MPPSTSVHEVRSVGSKEYCRSLKVFRVAPSCSRCLGHDELVERMSASVSLTLTQRSCLRCSDVSGSDAVALDVVLAVLGADVSCKHLQSALGSRVCGYSLASELAHHGADVDDLSVTFLNHSRDNRLGNDERCVQVYIDDFAEFICLHLKHRFSQMPPHFRPPLFSRMYNQGLRQFFFIH